MANKPETHSVDAGSDSDTNDVVQSPKEFFSKSLAESLFNGLLKKVRNKGIPRQKGFIHLNKVKGYGESAVMTLDAKEKPWPPIPFKNLLRTTRKLTIQAAHEACDKERLRRIKDCQQKGIHFYMPMTAVLEEFRVLVRNARKRDEELSTKDFAHVKDNWTVVMEEIQRRGMLGSIGEQVEKQRRDTMHMFWENMENKADKNEASIMASVHNQRKRVHEDLKCAVRKIMDQAKAEGDAMNAYYSDLYDQVVRAFDRRVFSIQIQKQSPGEINSRLEENHQLKDDPLRLTVIDAREEIHKDLKALLVKVKSDEHDRELKMVKRQEGLRENVLQEVVHSYWRKKTQGDFAHSKLEKIAEEDKAAQDPATHEAKQRWQNLQNEVVLASRRQMRKSR